MCDSVQNVCVYVCVRLQSPSLSPLYPSLLEGGAERQEEETEAHCVRQGCTVGPPRPPGAPTSAKIGLCVVFYWMGFNCYDIYSFIYLKEQFKTMGNMLSLGTFSARLKVRIIHGDPESSTHCNLRKHGNRQNTSK